MRTPTVLLQLASLCGNSKAREKVAIRALLKPISLKTIRNWHAASRWAPPAHVSFDAFNAPSTIANRRNACDSGGDTTATRWLYRGWGAAPFA